MDKKSCVFTDSSIEQSSCEVALHLSASQPARYYLTPFVFVTYRIYGAARSICLCRQSWFSVILCSASLLLMQHCMYTYTHTYRLRHMELVKTQNVMSAVRILMSHHRSLESCSYLESLPGRIFKGELTHLGRALDDTYRPGSSGTGLCPCRCARVT